MRLSEPLGGLFAQRYEEILALEARSRMDTGAIWPWRCTPPCAVSPSWYDVSTLLHRSETC